MDQSTFVEQTATDSTLLESVEGDLTTALLAWSAASVVAGAAVAVLGRRANNEQLVSFGRQSAAWGAIDALIAGGGVLSRRNRGPLTVAEEMKKARGLRRLLLVNAAADVGYVVGGLLVQARGRKGQKTLRMDAGDGVAIAVVDYNLATALSANAASCKNGRFNFAIQTGNLVAGSYDMRIILEAFDGKSKDPITNTTQGESPLKITR